LLLNKPPSPCEVLNDIDGGLVNLWQVVADPERFERFRFAVELTPHSRRVHSEALERLDDPDSVQAAVALFIRLRQGFSGTVGGGWGFSRTESTAGISRSTAKWLRGVDRLPEIFLRLRRVQIEEMDFRRLIPLYDTSRTFFYVDPPYVLETRTGGARYRCELQLTDHEDLVDSLLAVKGMVLLSGYRHAVYDRLEDAGWERRDLVVQAHAAGRTRPTGVLGPGSALAAEKRIESVWLSPSLQAGLRWRQGRFF
jgi:DNA adenine methylase